MDPAVAAVRASLKRDHREACTADTPSASAHEQPRWAELAVATSSVHMTSPVASRQDAPHDYERRSVHEATRSVLARLFHDSSSSPSLHSAVSRLTVETADDSHQSIEPPPRRELLALDGAPLSWPRAYSRQSNQLSNLIRSHTTNNHIIQTSAAPDAAPRSASSDFYQQLQMHQQQRFFVRDTERRKQQKQYPEAEAEPQDEVSMLKEQVTLLLKNLEDEKKRRHLEQKLMQEKIIELQGVIRRNCPEQGKALERRIVAMRSPSAARSKLLRSSSKYTVKVPQLSLSRKSSKSSDMSNSVNSCSGASEECDENSQLRPRDNNSNEQEDDPEDQKKVRASSTGSSSSPGGVGGTNGVKAAKEDAKAVEARMKRQLTKLRARMQAMVTDAQLEAQNLRMQLQSEQQAHDRKERQLRMEANAKLVAAELMQERHATAKKRLTAKVALLSSHVTQLLTENEVLEDRLKEKDARIAHLELAVGGRLIVDNLYPSQQQRQQQQQS